MHTTQKRRSHTLLALIFFFTGFFFLIWRQRPRDTPTSTLIDLGESTTIHNDQEVVVAPTIPTFRTTRITREEFERARQEVRILAPKCKQNPKLPGCITEPCPTLPFGFNGRPEEHRENVVGNNCEPWIRREIILMLDRLLKPDFTVLEWSSGSSTIWTLPRVRRMISVESDAEWANSVIERVKDMGLSHKIQFHIIPPTKDPIKSKYDDGNDNASFEWAKSKHEGYYYQQYVGVDIPKEYYGKFDMVIVDGRARSACLKRAVSLLKQEGGLLMLDNSERERYKKDVVPEYWPKYEATGSPTETTLWLSQLPYYDVNK